MRQILVLPVVFVLLVALTAHAVAQGRKADSPFRVGQKVEVTFGGTRSAVVEKIMANGWLRLRFDDGTTSVLPSKRVHSIDEENAADTAVQSAELRTWTDSSGKFQVEARFLRLADDQVTIEQEGGKQITLPLTRLSAADQAYVNSLGQSNSRTGPSANASSATVDFPIATFDVSKARQIKLSGAQKTPVAPDPAGEISPLTTTPIPIQTGAGSPGPISSKAKCEAVVIHRPTGRAFASIAGEPHASHGSGQVVCFDLKEGRVLGSVALPRDMRVVDFSPSGKRMLALGGTRDKNVYVWDLQGDAQPLVAWQPYSPPMTRVDLAAFVDEDHVVTAGGNGWLALWNTERKRAVYSLPLLPFTVPALSPGRKQIAVATTDGLFLLDPASGSPLTMLPGDAKPMMHFCFRDDGRQLAAMGTLRTRIWDLEKAEQVRDIHFLGNLGRRSIAWLSPNYMLVDGRNLLDLDRRVVLWRYHWKRGSGTGAACGGRYWSMLADSAGQQALVPLELPHPEAEEVARALVPQDLLAMQPGSDVAVEVNVKLSPEDQIEVRDTLVLRLSDMGMHIVPDADLVLSAETAEGRTKEVAYQAAGTRDDSKTAKITEQISQLKITEKGRELWKVTMALGAPISIAKKKGQSLDAAIANRTKPNKGFFVNTPLPRYLARSGENGVYGESEITAEGIQAVQKK